MVEAPTNVVNLMDALRKSLDAVSAGKKKTAKAELPQKKVAAKAGERRRKAG
jgi:non-homologous end joining protein Ku